MLVVVHRHEPSDAEWAVLLRLLPSSGTVGRARSGDRLILNGIVWKLRTGSAWRDVPEGYGSWQTWRPIHGVSPALFVEGEGGDGPGDRGEAGQGAA
ncbi:transposase, partial [Streptomyces sp. NPDC048362]|uniref:transposase n=1 Tax=Streptomyces sp. NPDC048362 TaxID=3365539 RepID=UPI00371097A3